MEELIRILESRLGKVVYERQGQYYLLYFNIDGKGVIACIVKGYQAYYAKIVSENDVTILSCNEALYTPRGLFAFARSTDELAEAISRKIIYIGSN